MDITVGLARIFEGIDVFEESYVHSVMQWELSRDAFVQKQIPVPWESPSTLPSLQSYFLSWGWFGCGQTPSRKKVETGWVEQAEARVEGAEDISLIWLSLFLPKADMAEGTPAWLTSLWGSAVKLERHEEQWFPYFLRRSCPCVWFLVNNHSVFILMFIIESKNYLVFHSQVFKRWLFKDCIKLHIQRYIYTRMLLLVLGWMMQPWIASHYYFCHIFSCFCWTVPTKGMDTSDSS